MTLPLLLPRIFAGAYFDLVGTRPLRPLVLPRWTNPYGLRYLVPHPSEDHRTLPGALRSTGLDRVSRGSTRINWKRTKIPLFPASRATVPTALAQMTTGGLQFEGKQELPILTPRITIRRFIPDREMITIAEPNPRRDESHRRRKDQKVQEGFNRILSFANHRYRTYEDRSMLSNAWYSNDRDPARFLNAVAVHKALEHHDPTWYNHVYSRIYG